MGNSQDDPGTVLIDALCALIWTIGRKILQGLM